MSNKARNTAGKFAPKSEVPRKVRSVNLTDDAWQWLAATAEAAGMSRNDYLEALADGNNPLMETASAAPCPLMETVESEVEVSGAEIAELPIDKDIPLIETVEVEIEALKQELAAARTDYAKLLETSSHIKASREKEIAELRSQLATERADREELETQLADLKQNSEIDFDFAGKAGELVSWLRKTVGKALPKQVTPKEVQKILEGKDN